MKSILIAAFLLFTFAWAGTELFATLHQERQTAPSTTQTTLPPSQETAPGDTEATKRKAHALIDYLEKKKDKRVDKVVLNKYNWAGVPAEELVNYNIKIGEVKYTVVRQGKDKKDENYLSFDVKTGKESIITVDDEGVDGNVDRGMDVKNATKEEKKIYGTKAYELKDRQRWQAEYEKYLDALIQYLGITVPQT
jgi:hypothetical protein